MTRIFDRRCIRPPAGHPLKRSWPLALVLVLGALWAGAAPAQAAGESIRVLSVETVGCAADGVNDYGFTIQTAGFDGTGYTIRTTVTAGDKTYMDQAITSNSAGTQGWGLGEIWDYGPVANKGTWPIPASTPMWVTLTLERPKGTVLSSWTMVAKSCAGATLLYNGPTAADPDQDYVATSADRCPSLQGFSSNGCPVRDRTLTLRARYGPKRVVGKLYAPGFPAFYAGRTVTIWKVRPGPDRKVATRTTNSRGKFKTSVRPGRYYAKTGPRIVPTAGQVTAERSGRIRVR